MRLLGRKQQQQTDLRDRISADLRRMQGKWDADWPETKGKYHVCPAQGGGWFCPPWGDMADEIDAGGDVEIEWGYIPHADRIAHLGVRRFVLRADGTLSPK